MELERHGLKVVLRKIDNFLPGPNGSYLLAGRDGLTRSEIARHVPADGAAYDRYNEELDTVVPLIRKWLLKAPPGAGAGLRGLPQLASLGRDLIGLSTDEIRIVHEFATKSAGDILDRFFEGDLTKALFAFDGIVGNFASPYTPGTAYVLLHHLFGEAAGVPGAWGHAIGGMGAITQAMAKACREAGVDIVLKLAGQRDHRREGPRRRRGRGRQELARADHRRRGQSQAAVRPAGAQGRGQPPGRGAFRPLGLRKRDLPDECRARQAAQLHRRCRAAATI